MSLAPFGYDVDTVTHSHVVVTPKPPPPRPGVYWRIGPVTAKTASSSPTPTTPSERRAQGATESEFTVQLTADQQVALSISGEDAYGNPTDVTGDVAWWSSDEGIVQVFRNVDDNTKAIAIAIGPVGTAAITVSNDFDQDGTGDFQGSIAIDVVAGQITEITVSQGEVSTKPVPDQGLPPVDGTPSEPGTPTEPGTPGEPTDPGTPETPVEPTDPDAPIEPPDGTEPSPPRPDNTLPGDLPTDPDAPVDPDAPHPDNSLPGDQPVVNPLS